MAGSGKGTFDVLQWYFVFPNIVDGSWPEPGIKSKQGIPKKYTHTRGRPEKVSLVTRLNIYLLRKVYHLCSKAGISSLKVGAWNLCLRYFRNVSSCFVIYAMITVSIKCLINTFISKLHHVEIYGLNLDIETLSSYFSFLHFFFIPCSLNSIADSNQRLLLKAEGYKKQSKS
ncbi:hypothetical protein YC2023_090826 [Brassica napus]